MKKFDTSNTVIGYDYDKHLWIYDCKYYLIDGVWIDKETGEKIMELSNQDKKDIEKYKQQIIEQK